MYSRSRAWASCLALASSDSATDSGVSLIPDGDSARNTRWTWSENRSRLIHRMRSIEIEVQFQHVHPRLAEKTQLAAVGVRLDKTPHLVLRNPALTGDAGHLKGGGGRGD